MARRVSDSTIRRLSHYVRALETLERRGVPTVSSEELADFGGTTAAQVRKDFSHFGSFGKRGMGYRTSDLLDRLKGILGLDRRWRVALVGAGRIGAALFAYPNFRARGFDCIAVIDADPAKIGSRWGDLTVCPPEDLEDVIRNQKVDLVIIAVPAAAAQEVAERVVRAGARGILNFAPTQLRLPRPIPLTNVNLVMEMEALSFAITRADEEE